MRLIDADALAKFIDYGHLNNPNEKLYSENDIREMIDMMPTVDAVPVIRCKDCKFATITSGVYGREPEVKYCDIWFPTEAEYMPVNYYCASAERKEK